MRMFLQNKVLCCGQSLQVKEVFDVDTMTEVLIYQCSVCRSAVEFLPTKLPTNTPKKPTQKT
ncbi:hypothetical protein SAMN05877753_111135 [Bacillus oleivorans]|uniref:Uncharacterized protein n=1 Tax=Bacillus oleivorans TaxID=1448271 RepID=A0A285D636_9BACI|nr:hypothetical protein SAMN05877753_111135 [Bacillus oleivorans]